MTNADEKVPLTKTEKKKSAKKKSAKKKAAKKMGRKALHRHAGTPEEREALRREIGKFAHEVGPEAAALKYGVSEWSTMRYRTNWRREQRGGPLRKKKNAKKESTRQRGMARIMGHAALLDIQGTKILTENGDPELAFASLAGAAALRILGRFSTTEN
jgi:hypothetical protein